MCIFRVTFFVGITANQQLFLQELGTFDLMLETAHQWLIVCLVDNGV